MTTLPYHSPTPRSVPGAEQGSFATNGIVIDWSDDMYVRDEGAAEKLIAWVSTCPTVDALHVYLPSLRSTPAVPRLQRMLLSLGCTVTRRLRPST